MSTLSRQWAAIIAANLTGAVLVFIGAASNAAVQVLGLVLLFPGSVLAAVVPLEKLWHPVLWHCCQTDANGLSNILYLPVAISTNLLVWRAITIRLARVRPGKLTER